MGDLTTVADTTLANSEQRITPPLRLSPVHTGQTSTTADFRYTTTLQDRRRSLSPSSPLPHIRSSSSNERLTAPLYSPAARTPRAHARGRHRHGRKGCQGRVLG